MAVTPYLHDPNIVSALALVEDDAGQTVGIVVERCSETLEDACTESVSFLIIFAWLLQVARGMVTMHAWGVVHNRIMPSNVLMATTSSSGKVAKLANFQCSCLVDGTRELGASPPPHHDVPLFRPPELADPQTWPTKASDVFSFAMLMWSVLFPRPKHGLGLCDAQVIASIREGGRPPLELSGALPDMPATFVNIIGKCWDQDPALRPSMQAVEEALCLMATPANIAPAQLVATRTESEDADRTTAAPLLAAVGILALIFVAGWKKI